MDRLKRQKIRDYEIQLALSLEKTTSRQMGQVRNRVLPETREPQNAGVEVRNLLLDLYSPEKVDLFMSDMTPAGLEFIRSFWSNIESELRTKRNLSKPLFNKIIQKISRKYRV